MGTAPGPSEKLCNGGSEDSRTPTPAALRLPYAAPTLTVYGSLVNLTQKRGGPGRDNPHFLRSR
jgi:hypothetical protein